MPIVRDQAVCLRVTPFSETSQVVTLFTREHGRLRLLAKGATRRTKAGKGKFDGGLDLLDAGDAMFTHNPERDLSLLTEWKLTDGHRELRRDLRAMWLGQYCGELVDRLIEEHDPHPKLYDGFERLLTRLAEPEVREAVALAFTLNLLRQMGLLPDFNRCRLADRPMPLMRAVNEGHPVVFDVDASQFICGELNEPLSRSHPRSVPVPRSALDAILSLLSLTKNGGGLPQLSQPDATAAHRVLAAHVRHQIEGRLRMARYVLGEQD